MTTDETRQLILDIAMNCHRVGNWIADDYDGKKARIDVFLVQTQTYIERLQKANVPSRMNATRSTFSRVFMDSSGELKSGVINKDILAERFMTWGNILTHRAKLFS